MPATEPSPNLEELARMADEVYNRCERPALRPEDDGKFIAVDIDTGDYEINADDYTAVSRLRSRKPTSEVWLMRAGQRATYKMRRYP